MKSILLNNNTVQRRIDEMLEVVKNSLTGFLKVTVFSLHLDESILLIKLSLRLAYIPSKKLNKIVKNYLLFVRTLEIDSKGRSIFHALLYYVKKK